MERLTKKELGKTTGAVMCTYTAEQCNDSCMYGMCKWNKKALLKLKEYEDAEEQGLLIKLPCKVGDTVYIPIYRPNRVNVIKKKVLNDIRYQLGEWHIICANNFDDRDYSYRFDVIGKTVFLAEAEAEQALKDAVKE